MPPLTFENLSQSWHQLQETDQLAKSEAVPESAHAHVHKVFDQALLQASETQLADFSEDETRAARTCSRGIACP